MAEAGGIVSRFDPPVPPTDDHHIELMARAMAKADGYVDLNDNDWREGWRCENPDGQQLASSTDYCNLARRQFHALKALQRG